MRRRRWLLAAGVVVVLACTQELSTRERVVEQQLVEARLTTWVRVMNNAAQDSLFGMYHHGPELVVLWPDGRRTEGWEATREAWRAFYADTDYMNFVVQRPTIEVVAPRVAISTFRHSTDIVVSRRRQPVRAGHGTLVWVKDPTDGLWKIRLSQIAFEVPASN